MIYKCNKSYRVMISGFSSVLELPSLTVRICYVVNNHLMKPSLTTQEPMSNQGCSKAVPTWEQSLN